MLLENIDHIQGLESKNIFYRAVVEDNDDSGEKYGTLGRCRVRILGIHPENGMRTGKNIGVPIEELPWAELMVSTGFHGGMSGIGISAVPVKGTWVWVFFDGGDWNRPIIVGIIAGISNKQGPGPDTKTSGFNDPDKVYPIEKRIGEPDQNRLAANRKFAETPIKKIRDNNIDKGIPTATGTTWDEYKELTSKAKYPNNTVFETAGHSFIEYDSTPGNERIHFFHKTGTYWEAQDKGDFQYKTTRDHFGIIDRDYKRLVKRHEHITIQGNKEHKVDGTEDILIGDNHKETIKGTVTQIYKATKDETVTGKVTEKYNAGQTTNGGPQIIIKAGIIKLN